MTQTSPSSPKRRSADQWQTIVDRFHQSGQSAAAFCRDNAIGYASFCQWRRKLSTPPILSKPLQPGFIDLNLLSPGFAGEPLRTPWHIVLKLGNGVELCLSQSDVAA